jgi:hypothetical protein
MINLEKIKLEQEIKNLKTEIIEDTLNFKFLRTAAEHAIWNCERGCSSQQANEANSLANKAANLYEKINRCKGYLSLKEGEFLRYYQD